MNSTQFDGSFLEEITKFHLESTAPKPYNPFEDNNGQQDNEDEEEDSVFAPQKDPRTAKTILDELRTHMGDSSSFKIICNKIFTFVKGYKSDPTKSFNKVLALMNEDFSNDQKARDLLIELFSS